MDGWMSHTNAYEPGAVGAVNEAVAPPPTRTANEPSVADTVCSSPSAFVTATTPPGRTDTGANRKSAMASGVGAAAPGAGAAGAADGGVAAASARADGRGWGFTRSVPAVKSPAAAHTTRDPVSRLVMAPGTPTATVRFANRTMGPGVPRDMTRSLTSHGPVRRPIHPVLPPALAGACVALALGVYGRVHVPTRGRIVTPWFDSLLAMKAWLATVAFALMLLQLVSALAMFGRLPGVRRAPRWLGPAHRWSGTAAFVVSLPVAYHCLWSLGFADTGARPLAHGLFGCFFYGAFATKMLALRAPDLPRGALPVMGGLLVTMLTGVWLTSALWFFTTFGLTTG